jgi:hypothetical protein
MPGWRSQINPTARELMVVDQWWTLDSERQAEESAATSFAGRDRRYCGCRPATARRLHRHAKVRRRRPLAGPRVAATIRRAGHGMGPVRLRRARRRRWPTAPVRRPATVHPPAATNGNEQGPCMCSVHGTAANNGVGHGPWVVRRQPVAQAGEPGDQAPPRPPDFLATERERDKKLT